MTKYITIPYEEYNEMLNRLESFDNIYYMELFPRGLKKVARGCETTWNFHKVRGKKQAFLWDLCQLDIRTQNILFMEWELGHFRFVGELVQKTENDIYKLPNFGRKCLNYLKSELEKHNLSLGMNLPDYINDHIRILTKAEAE